MQTHQNTLYVQTQGAYLGKQGETLRIKVDGQEKLVVPVHHLEGVVCFGRISVSSAAMELCNERNVSISFPTEQGRFQARVVPATSGNVLLRREQYRRADRPEACLMIARAVVPAQDAVRYVLMAQSYERDGLIVSMKADAEHPLYPLLMWLVHEAVELAGGDLGWALCAQLTSAAMLVVSLVPVYLLLLRLVGAAAATAGGLFYSVMTSVARLGADALADSTQLALVAAALYCTARWLEGKRLSSIQSVWLFAAGGLIGLAMLTRPEATVLLPAMLTERTAAAPCRHTPRHSSKPRTRAIRCDARCTNSVASGSHACGPVLRSRSP